MTETADQARTRRRWITLAELVALAGVVIGALSLWNSWTERRDAAAERQASATKETRQRQVIRLDGTLAGDGQTVTLADPDHRLDGIDLAFPTALGVAPQVGLARPRIEAGWIAPALLKATDGGPDVQSGKLPVLVTAHWWDADTRRDDRAIYEVAWSTKGRVLQGRALRLDGVLLRERGGSAKRLDALWTRPKP
jgi:hypothetical protein